jgi:hypothetical protein
LFLFLKKKFCFKIIFAICFKYWAGWKFNYVVFLKKTLWIDIIFSYIVFFMISLFFFFSKWSL